MYDATTLNPHLTQYCQLLSEGMSRAVVTIVLSFVLDNIEIFLLPYLRLTSEIHLTHDNDMVLR